MAIPPVAVPTSVTISASATSVTTGDSSVISGEVKDQNGNNMAGVTVYLFQIISGQAPTQVSSQVTQADGYAFTVIFNNVGSFTYNVSTDTSDT